jgi:hypothetical protein
MRLSCKAHFRSLGGQQKLGPFTWAIACNTLSNPLPRFSAGHTKSSTHINSPSFGNGVTAIEVGRAICDYCREEFLIVDNFSMTLE